MKFGVVVFPGSNCDHDTFYVLREILNQEVVELWHKEHDLKGVDGVILPGGFSYGDYLRSGAIARFSPDVIILDDAFQHRRLYRDMDFVMVDATVGFGNGFLLPRGILREPLEALARADAIVMTRSDTTDSAFDAEIVKTVPHIPVFRSVNQPFLYGVVKANEEMPTDIAAKPDSNDLGFLQNKRILGVSGIARNTEFKRMVSGVSGQMVDFLEFPDHYAYSVADLHRIFKRAGHFSVDCVVTTQKDYARLQGRMKAPPVDMAVMGIQMDFGGDREALINYLDPFLKPKPAR